MSQEQKSDPGAERVLNVVEAVAPGLPETDYRGSLRIAAWLLAVGLVLGGLWAAVAPLDEGVPAQGVVTSEGSRKRVEHLSGGIVSRILVREGQAVSKGQPLVHLDETQARAALAQTEAQWAAAMALRARLQAERDAAAKIDFPASLRSLGRQDPDVATLMQRQDELFRTRRRAQDGNIRLIDASVTGLESQLTSLARLRQERERQVSLFRERLDSFKNLKDEGFISRHYLLDIERQLAEIEGRLSEDLSNIASVQARLADFRLRGQQLEMEFQRDVDVQLVDVEKEISGLEERRVAQRDAFQRMTIEAPLAGVVVDLAVHGAGEVVQPGGRLLDIVPGGERLVVEAKVDPHLVDRLRVGLPVKVHLDAFANRSSRPVLAGKVEVVSADALVDGASGQPYYSIRVGLSPSDTGDTQVPLQPGMPVHVLVRTGERPLLVYLLRPLLTRFVDALHD